MSSARPSPRVEAIAVVLLPLFREDSGDSNCEHNATFAISAGARLRRREMEALRQVVGDRIERKVNHRM